MRLRCGGKFNNSFIAYFQQIVTLEEFWKSASIWWSYTWNTIGSIFFWTRCILRVMAFQNVLLLGFL